MCTYIHIRRVDVKVVWDIVWSVSIYRIYSENVLRSTPTPGVPVLGSFLLFVSFRQY